MIAAALSFTAACGLLLVVYLIGESGKVDQALADLGTDDDAWLDDPTQPIPYIPAHDPIEGEQIFDESLDDFDIQLWDLEFGSQS